MSLRSYNPTYRPNYAQIRKVVDALYNAERPLLFGGGGVIMSNASEEFRNLAKNLSIPVTCSLMGLGAFPVIIRSGSVCSVCTGPMPPTKPSATPTS